MRLKSYLNMELRVYYKPRQRVILFILWLLFTILSFPVFSQPGNSVIGKLAGRLDSLAKNTPQEMAYLQSSKAVYETGEDLWFKAYLLNTQNLVPSPLSQTLYLQVIHEKTEASVWQEKYEIQNGFAHGQVFLQENLTEGDYLLEAFTAHSFFKDSPEFKAIRRIKVKKDMNPRPSFTAAFDKVHYKAGDTIKVTITSLSDDYKPLYAEIDAELLLGDKKLGQARAATNPQGKASLNFVLSGPAEKLRVKTIIKHGEKEDLHDFTVPNKKGNPIQFDVFPEGGNLVAGIQNKLAFKAINIDGNPIEVKGTLYENDKPLLEFKSAHAGMGNMDFSTVAGKKYHIRLSEPATDSTFVLPEILPKGIAMRLTARDKEYLEFIISQSPGLASKTIYLRGQIRGTVYCLAEGKLNRELKIKIPLKEFPQQGIAEFTLFNENLLPVAERLVYIHPNKKLHIEAILDKEKYETRERATLKIKTTDENDQPVTANLGISVYDKLYQNTGDQKNILTHYFLSEQLKGSIYDPVYYFNKKNKDRTEALDLLLLTQGWRKYVWSEENLKEKDKQPVISNDTEGEVHFTRKLKIAQKGEQFIMAFNPGENETSNLIVTDLSGRFAVSPIHLKTWQGGYVYLKPMGPSAFKPHISLADPFQQLNEAMKVRKISYPLPDNTDTFNEDPIHSFVVGPNVIELDEVTIKGKVNKLYRDKHMGHLDSIALYDLCTDYVGTCNTLNCPFHNKDRSKKPVEGKSYKVLLGKNGEILGADYPYKYYFGERTIIYHNPNKNFTEEELLKMNNLYRIKAYYGKKVFYQPNYDKENENEFLPDTRNTLLWSPSVETDEKGEATLEFFCSDINTRFVGRIEGVSRDGLLGTGDFEFNVRKTKPFKQEK